MSVLLTVGHSNHTIEHFFDLLIMYEVEFLIDVRSHPYSKYAPQFSRENLKIECRKRKIRYAYFGDSLGGRPRKNDHYDECGRALYYKMAQEYDFIESCQRITTGIRSNLLALMCSEENPLYCHRRLLIARSIIDESVDIFHIRGNSYLQSEDEISVKNPLKPLQADIFSQEDTKWRSFQSVLRRPQQKDFSQESERMVYGG